jgi:CRISPR/Cas system CSM-associated protein Csm3 (group 7 of RAMP superfamily)
MNRMPAPYAFVPLASQVVSAENLLQRESKDQAPTVLDEPFLGDDEGWSGTFDLEVEALTPILVRGASEPGKEQHAKFNRTPDGKYAIPGSSLRGMLRNVVEIASFAKMSRVYDRTYAVRDLHNRELYISHMAALKNVGGKSQPVPLVCAGWLQRRPNVLPDDEDLPLHTEVADIHVVDFFKLDYGLLLASRLAPPNYNPGRKQTSVDKYRAWSTGLEVRFAEKVWDKSGERTGESPARIGDFGKIERLGGEGMEGRRGTLVFTGQPADWKPGFQARPGAGQPKHSDFVFGHEKRATLPVSRKLYKRFVDAHSDVGQQGRTTAEPNAEWGHWRRTFLDSKDGRSREQCVPVFFLLDKKKPTEIRAFGLAMMFRLAYEHSVGEARDNAQLIDGELRAKFDIAEAIFGRVVEPDRRNGEKESGAPPALAGRVSIGLARALGDPQPLKEIKAVLGGPKASYYPAYVAQNTDPSGLRSAGSFKTYMDADAQIAGWKRYRPQDAVEVPPIPAMVKSEKVFTYMSPLPVGTRFTAPVRIHNLRKWELGALLWALTYGDDAAAVHGLGLAKSLGYGRVRLRVKNWQVLPHREWPDDPFASVPAAELAEVARLAKAYADHMETKCGDLCVDGGWQNSVQIRELVAAARPLPSGSRDGRWMTVERPNEFQECKKELLVLPLASGSVRRVPPAQKRVGGAAVGGSPAAIAGTTAVAASTVAADSREVAGVVKQFRDGKVKIQLEDGTVVEVVIDVRVFLESAWKKPRFNGNDFPVGKKLRVRLDGEKVGFVGPG